MASSLPSTQRAIAMTSKRAPLAEISVPVHPPAADEVVVRVAWTASTPLDLHRADGGLLVASYPAQAGGGGIAGTVVAVGGSADLVKGLGVGDRVMAFAFRGGKEANHQEYVTVPAYLVSSVPPGLTLREACTVPVNLVTVFHAATADLGLDLPWPLPDTATTPDDDQDPPIVVWGASSSVGIYALQVLRHWYRHRRLLAVSSRQHHPLLLRLGATACFDRADPRVVDAVLASVGSRHAPLVLDCIGSLDGSLRPLARIAQPGSRVAVMLPVIIRDATDDEEPEYEMDVSKCLPGLWADGVLLRGVRTHFYLQNEFFKEMLQPEIVPALLAQGVVEPNRQRVVEGATMLERAQKALDLLRSRTVSGERLVWQVAP
ncbi:zinc-binding dehydrogenase [Hirsutella rhossiliensis]|uniref:Zinc-binding dehydrogenase domain-containing protein n=1 Tax=Hirsutella rhossiliensis TaxID=111463 RepID=A0A9P8MQN6_9HYPO|nr:zinc-binding dehydrogenase domain-containing protein [Hirsutella rhossiliensis]KAH0957462.1 zinc-binding dehydrogenase domain-containing protein [Hirsutella rhossiliensis]